MQNLWMGWLTMWYTNYRPHVYFHITIIHELRFLVRIVATVRLRGTDENTKGTAIWKIHAHGEWEVSETTALLHRNRKKKTPHLASWGALLSGRIRKGRAVKCNNIGGSGRQTTSLLPAGAANALRPTELRLPIEWLGAMPRLCADAGCVQATGRVMCGVRAEKRLPP